MTPSILGRDYVELNRTFHELSKYARESDDVDLSHVFHVSDPLGWDALINEYSVVILSEAGSGKTAEIRNKARQLKAEGKAAFFVRLEHIPDDFEGAFEVGTFEEFQAWLDSNEEGWLLLDSVDEARLRNPSDFERAIRILGKRVAIAKERAHVFITGRTFAWRPKTDLMLCATHLPFTRAIVREKAEQTEGADEDAAEASSDQLLTQAGSKTDIAPAFKIIALDDLSPAQIEAFARAYGVTDTKSFLDAIDRADASTFTGRPQDLRDVVDFWLDQQRIGSRLELMQNSIERRLSERDQTRAEAKPISPERIREGARMLAAATTLAKEPTIRVPDGAENTAGVAVGAILAGWDEKDQSALLSRPIFDEAIYGTVRFHHRSVREYLAAEWFAQLLRRETSRRKVEALFFRNQYGIDVVTPTLRPVLPWLAILDKKIREKLRRIAPEVLLEGGDPSQLPLETKRQILNDVCEKLASGTSGRSMTDYSAVQRFASPDLTEDVKRLLGEYVDNEELSSFLLRMVWLGQIKGALPEAKAAALSPASAHYARIAAMRAVVAIGSKQDLEDVQQSFLTEATELSRDWLGELIEHAERGEQTAQWLLACLAKSQSASRYSVDNLSQAVLSFVKDVAVDLLPLILAGFCHLLDEPPVIERRYCEISQRFSWLLQPTALGMERLVQARNVAALQPDMLDLLRKIPLARHFSDIDLRVEQGALKALIPEWPELNRALFWKAVEAARSGLDRKRSERLTDYWQAGAWESFWRFDDGDFDYVANQIAERPFQDDKLVALSLAFDIYRNAGRPRRWRERLKRIVSGNQELNDKLGHYLRPPANSNPATRWKRQDAQWKRRAQAREKKEAENNAKWKEHLDQNVDKLRNPGFAEPSTLSNDQWYLHERMRGNDGFATRWTQGNWQALIPEFGEEIARAFRDGAVRFWRNSDPVIRSEGAKDNSTPYSVIFGLTGLEIEAHEEAGWIERLTDAEVRRACRYASFELNGFPAWFPGLFAARPHIVSDFLVQEIEFELSVETGEANKHYVLADVSWSGQWAWPLLGPRVLAILRDWEPLNVENLERLLTILQGSEVTDADLAALARSKVASVANLDSLARWYAVWVGIDPRQAIDALTAKFEEIEGESAQTTFAMNFITNLVGGRRDRGIGTRSAFQSPEHLKSLYVLMHTYVNRKDDIDRAGTGVYSPGLRDDAQEARNALFEMLNKLPGKEAFLALDELSKDHPDQTSRPWMTYLTKSKAQQDSDLQAWSPSQVREFHDALERTPATHRELAELAAMRLLDLQDDLEEGDASLADILVKGATLETEMRRYIGKELREKAFGRYNIPQEEELADAKKPDLRFLGNGFDGPVPVELKLADKWSGSALFERMENQLCGDYLRDNRSNRGFFLLVYRGEKSTWQVPGSSVDVDFQGLVDALQRHWTAIAGKYPSVEEVVVIGIDLTKRTR